MRYKICSDVSKSEEALTLKTHYDIIQICDTSVLYSSYTTASKMSSKILGGTAMSKVNIAEEARSIAQKYQEKPEMVNKIELLRKLDQSVTKMPSVISLSVGIIGILIFGLGMCCWLVWSDLSVLGTVLCVVGAAVCIANYPLYSKMVAAKKEELAPQIIALSNEIASENN